jgi:hypothetical protein
VTELQLVTEGEDQHSRCAAWAREVGLSAAGTAPQADVFVWVEHPLPWSSDVGSDPLLRDLQNVAAEQAGPGRSVRLQAVAVDAERSLRKVVVFQAATSPFAGYGRAEGLGAVEDLPELVAGLVGLEPRPPMSRDVTDVLVCTHGSRDTCCGSMGTRLWKELEETVPNVRIWRTSHTGGHRFAPTAITFPDGNYWAHLDAAIVRGLVRRALDPVQAAQHLRGCAAFPPAVQVADGAVLALRGWEWLDCARFGHERSPTRVELCFEAPNGERGGYDVLLDEGRRMPVPDCGADPAAATKSQVELTVATLRQWT